LAHVLVHPVTLVVFEEHARVATVGAHHFDVGGAAGGHCIVDLYLLPGGWSANVRPSWLRRLQKKRQNFAASLHGMIVGTTERVRPGLWVRCRFECVCETYKWIRHLATGCHHLVKGHPLALGCQHDHQAARFKGKAIDKLSGCNGDATVFVYIDEVQSVLGYWMSTIRLLWVDLRARECATAKLEPRCRTMKPSPAWSVCVCVCVCVWPTGWVKG
jgi:hypothetical protein